MYDVAKRDALVSQFYRAGGDAQALTHALLSAYRLGLGDGKEVSAASPAPAPDRATLPPWGWLDDRLVEAIKAQAKVAAPPLRPPVYGAQEEADHKAAVSAPQGEIKPATWTPAWVRGTAYKDGDTVTHGRKTFRQWAGQDAENYGAPSLIPPDDFPARWERI